MTASKSTSDQRPRAALIPPRVWHSTWGQEKNLAAGLAPAFRIDVLDLVDFGGRHHRAGPNRFDPPSGGRVIERPTPPGLALQGLYMELATGLRVLFGRYDLVISYLTLGGVLAALAARLRGAKLLLIYADDYVEFYAQKNRWAGLITEKLANPLVGRLAHRSAATARLLAEDIRPHAPGVVHLPNGCDAQRLAAVPSKTGGRFTVGFVGGFGHWVDFEAVIEAARLRPEIEFRLIGGGDRFEEVSALAANLDNVTLTGQVHYDQVLAELARLDAALIPFKVNRLTDRVSPIKLFEYWAAGQPVIASRCREIEETAGDAAAAYYRFGDGSDLASVIDRLRGEADWLASLIAAGRDRLAAYDWANIIDRYWELLTDMGFERPQGAGR